MSRYEDDEKKSIGFMIFAILLSIILVVFTAFLMFQVFRLQILPENILFPILLALLLFTIILVLLINFWSHGIISKIIFSLLVIAVSATYGLGNYYLYSTNKTLQTVTTQAKQAKNTVSVVTLSSSSIEDAKDLEGAKLGVLKNIGKESTQKSLKDLSKQGVTYTKKSMTICLAY